MLIQPEKAALVKARLRKAVHLCEKLWTRFVSAGAKGLKNAEKWALRILKRAEGWLGKLPAQAVKEKIKAAFTQECRSRQAVNLVMPVACVLVLASVLSLVPLAPRAAAADHEPAAETANLTITPRYAAAEIAEKSRNRAPALRLITPEERWGFTDGHMGRYEENLAADCGDFLLRRSDGMFAYQLAVVVDDAAMGVTEVVRGADLLDSTPRQLYLYHLLGLTPPVFYHFPLLLTAEGRRLSKRDGAVGLDSLQDRLPPEEILGRLAFLARFNPSAAPKTAAELLADFAWEKVPRQDIRIPAGLFC